MENSSQSERHAKIVLYLWRYVKKKDIHSVFLGYENVLLENNFWIDR